MRFKISILIIVSAFFLSHCSNQDPMTATVLVPIKTDTHLPLNQSAHRIDIRLNEDGNSEFYDSLTEQSFLPQGYNYTHVTELAEPCLVTGVMYHSTFNVGSYDAVEAELMLTALQDMRYNIVRVFINPECMVDRNGNFLPAYIANLADFLGLAQAHDQQVIITTDGISSALYGEPIKKENDIWWQNTQYLYPTEIELEKKFWRDFITALNDLNAPLDTVFAYELRNEMYFDPNFAPLNQSQGQVSTADHHIYDMGVPADKERMVEESFIYWSREIRDTILSIDPNALVTVGFFAPEPFGRPSQAAIFKSDLDFVDLHMYPKEEVTMEMYGTYFGLHVKTLKPLVMGEFGIVDGKGYSLPEVATLLQNWQTASCQYNITGWLMWAWQTDQGASLSISDDEDTLFSTLAPFNRPNPCEN